MRSIAETSIIVAFTAMTLACGDATVGQGSKSVETRETISEMPGFSWVVEGELAAMPLPGRQRAFSEDVSFLQKEGIRRLISLTEESANADALAVAGIDQEHMPIRDFSPPTLDQMVNFVGVVSRSVESGEPVGVHCTAGLGRSGTMAAAYLVSKGLSAQQAVITVRDLRPGSIETDAQEAAISLFEQHLVGSPAFFYE